MIFRYVPIIKWKRGERVGLSNLAASAKARCTPLLVLGTDQFNPKAATRTSPATSAPDVFAQQLNQAWGHSVVFLDASDLPQGPQFHPLQAIAVSVATLGCRIIPATSLAAPQNYQAAVAAVAQAQNAGVCLRIDLQEAAAIHAWVAQWPYNPQDTDLVIDFNEAVGQVAALGAPLDQVFLGLHNGAQWRSVTVAGTSMPQNFTGYVQGLHLLPRAEWTLWQKLSALQLPYRLDYGDFTSVPLGAPPPRIAWGYPINVRYTLDNEFLICRGVRTTGPGSQDMAPQLVGHANSIMNYANRHAIVNSWADTTIDLIATGGADPQGLEHWVQLGVNRHIELVHAILP